MKKPLELFFSIGDKVSKGDPKRKADFDYYLIWIIFIAFFTIMIDRFVDFFNTWSFTALGWAIVMFCICWFQYSNLRIQYEARKVTKNINLQTSDRIESVEEMLR
jgi:hypothetical protein